MRSPLNCLLKKFQSCEVVKYFSHGPLPSCERIDFDEGIRYIPSVCGFSINTENKR